MPPPLYNSLRPALVKLSQDVDHKRAKSKMPSPVPAVKAPIAIEEMRSQVTDVWSRSAKEAGIETGALGSQSDVARSVLELVGRELIMAVPLEEPDFDATPKALCMFQTRLQDRLDIVLTLYEVVHGENADIPSIEPGALLIPLFDDLVDLLSMESWETLWGYFESRGPRFTKDMPSSRGKALPLLKFLNSFYRYLPRTSTYLSFRARVHEWATTAFEISDKSSVNFRGDFPLMARLAWEDEDVPEEDVEMVDGEPNATTDFVGEAEGARAETAMETPMETTQDDVKLKSDEDATSEKTGNALEAKEVEVPKALEETFDLYSAFWSLQTFLTYPPSLTDQAKTKATPNSPERTAFETFRVKTDFVLPHLYDAPRTEDAQIMLGKRLREVGDVEGEPVAKKGPVLADPIGSIGVLPRYLPRRRLFEYQLADVAFRRQVYIQYLILIRFLLNFTPSAEKLQAQFKVHKNAGGVGGEGIKSVFVLSKEDETWLRDTLTKVRVAVTKSGPGGRSLRATMAVIIRSEDHYAKWKSAGCPSDPFSKAPMPESRVGEVGRLWRRKVQPSQPWWHKLGTESLTTVWRNSLENAEQLKEWKNQPTVASLDESLQQAHADLAALADDDPAKASKAARLEELQNTLNWRGLRLATKTHLTEFKFLKETRNLHDLVGRINGHSSEPNGTAADEPMDNTDAPAPADMEGVETTETAAEAEQTAVATPGTPPLEPTVSETVEADQIPSTVDTVEGGESTKEAPAEFTEETLVPAADAVPASVEVVAKDEDQKEATEMVEDSPVVKSEGGAQTPPDPPLVEEQAQDQMETPVEDVKKDNVAEEATE